MALSRNSFGWLHLSWEVIHHFLPITCIDRANLAIRLISTSRWTMLDAFPAPVLHPQGAHDLQHWPELRPCDLSIASGPTSCSLETQSRQGTVPWGTGSIISRLPTEVKRIVFTISPQRVHTDIHRKDWADPVEILSGTRYATQKPDTPFNNQICHSKTRYARSAKSPVK